MLTMLIVWLIISIIVGIALGRFLQECEDLECQQRNALSPTRQHIAQDAALATWSTIMYNHQ